MELIILAKYENKESVMKLVPISPIPSEVTMPFSFLIFPDV